MGELQDTSYKIIESYNKGYQKGQQDLTINNVHKKYNGLCIEFKTPNGNGKLSDEQKELLERYEEQTWKYRWQCVSLLTTVWACCWAISLEHNCTY